MKRPLAGKADPLRFFEHDPVLSVRHCFGEDVEDNDTRDNQAYAQYGRGIQTLAKIYPAHKGDQDYADTAPDGICNTYGNGAKCNRKEKERGRIRHNS